MIRAMCRFIIFLFNVFRMVMASTPELQKQIAVPGKPVSLTYPCNISDISGIMLTNPDSNHSSYVFLYRDGRPDPRGQNPLYKDKVYLEDKRKINGTLVFTLQEMNHSFVGKYNCYVFQNGERILIGTKDLRAEESGGRNTGFASHNLLRNLCTLCCCYFIYFMNVI